MGGRVQGEGVCYCWGISSSIIIVVPSSSGGMGTKLLVSVLFWFSMTWSSYNSGQNLKSRVPPHWAELLYDYSKNHSKDVFLQLNFFSKLVTKIDKIFFVLLHFCTLSTFTLTSNMKLRILLLQHDFNTQKGKEKDWRVAHKLLVPIFDSNSNFDSIAVFFFV